MVIGFALSFTSSAVFAGGPKDGEPCDDSGNLKGWAKKHYDASYCAPVVTNTAPSISITAPGDAASFLTDATINLQASANDAEDGNLSGSVTWTSSLDGALSSSTQLSEGNHIITARVTDSGNLSATDSITVAVSAPAPVNTAPTISIDSPTNGSSVEETTALLFKATAADAEDGNLSGQVQWSSSLDGSIANLSTLSVGDHVITATVADSDGVSVSDSIALTVTAIEVATTHDLSISWDAPTHRADGTLLMAEEIHGYRIRWTNEATGATESVMVEDAYATHHQLTALESGVYQITLNTLDVGGRISADSTVTMVDLTQ